MSRKHIFRRWSVNIVLPILLLLCSHRAEAQVTVSYTFTDGTTADADEINSNFTALASNALNRTGGAITGNITVTGGVTIDGVDVGAVLGGTGTPTFTSATSGLFLASANGTNGAPVFSRSTDPDTGLYFTGANAVALTAGGTQRLLADSNGITVTAAVNATTGFKERGRTPFVGEWTTYTPTWGNAGAGQPVLGNGTITGSYMKIGKTVHYDIVLTLGTTSTSGTSGGAWLFSLPSTPTATQHGNAFALDTGVGNWMGQAYRYLATANVVLYFGTIDSSTTSAATDTVPFTWNNTDVVKITGWYEET